MVSAYESPNYSSACESDQEPIVEQLYLRESNQFTKRTEIQLDDTTGVERILWWRKFIAINQQYGAENGADPGNVSTEKVLDWAISHSAKLVSGINPSDDDCRRNIVKFIVESQEGITCVLRVLEGTVKSSTGVDLSLILRECTNPRNGSHRATAIRTLIGGEEHLEMFFKILAELQENVCVQTKAESTATTVNVIWVISAMAQKDTNFVAKVRTMSKVKFLHSLMKTHFFGKHHTHYPFLKIFRVLVKNKKVATTLGKDKIMKLIQKIFTTFNNQPSQKFLIVFEILAQLTLQKENSRRFLKAGLLVSVMRAFSYWQLWKGNGLLKLCKCLTSIYSHLCLTRAGRKALVKTEALNNLLKFCEQAPAEKSFDDVLTKIAAVAYRAHKKDKILIDDLASAYKFEAPPGANGREENRDTGASSSDDEEMEQQVDVEESEDDEDKDSADEDANINTLESDEDDVEKGDNEDLIKTSTFHHENDEDDSLIIEEDKVTKPTKEKNKTAAVYTGAGDASSMVGTANVKKFQSVAHFFKEFDSASKDTILVDAGGDATRKNEFFKYLSNSQVQENCKAIQLPTAEPRFFWLSDNPEYGSTQTVASLRSDYFEISNRVRSVISFVKVAYPDYVMAYGARRIEYLNPNADRGCLRNKLTSHISRAGTEVFKSKVVYSLDTLTQVERNGSLKSSKCQHKNEKLPLGNNDEMVVGKFDGRKDYPVAQPLKFESRFESGNLRKAVQVGETEYDLYLNSDVNSDKHNQWFYFQISNVLEQIPYTFNVVNCIKPGSQFNYGMQPVVFSVGDCMEGRAGWHRSGSQICYFKNGYRNTTAKKKRHYYTASFTLNFHRRGDVCYIAYHYPYSYSRLLTEIRKLEQKANPRLLSRVDLLCKTVNGNDVPLVTLTGSCDPNSTPLEKRQIIFLTSRVHPGESNSSWVMHGILHKLFLGKGQEWTNLMDRCVFKIVPMLNPEGVINGCHRCGLTNEDLNRRWKHPDPVLHPTIYWTKSLVEYSCKIRNKVPAVFCDLHGHSTRKNVFFYGCSKEKSWADSDKIQTEDSDVLQDLPEAMDKRCEAFALPFCKFDVQKHRESTARVALWREFGIQRSFTLESSYCGCDRGNCKGFSLGIHHLITVGEDLVHSVGEIRGVRRCDPVELDESSAIPPTLISTEGGNNSVVTIANKSMSADLGVDKHSKVKPKRRRRTQTAGRGRVSGGSLKQKKKASVKV